MKECRGKVFVVGLGPGGGKQMSLEALEAIRQSDVVIGYKVYMELIKELIEGKEIFSSGMTKEIERCKMALDMAVQGKKVSLVSSGDPGIYGMAGPLLEICRKEGYSVDVQVVSGITAANGAAAILGAPLMHDTAVISLSDLLTPWPVIEKRLKLAAEGDFVTALYNPKSKSRPHYLKKAQEIFLEVRDENTPVGIVWNAGRKGERKVITTLGNLDKEPVDMFAVVIIGNSCTYVTGEQMITPRGYDL